MFSAYVNVPLHSNLGRAPGYIQHILATSLVDAVSTMPGCGDAALRLKWPNDIYYGRWHKIGGVVVQV